MTGREIIIPGAKLDNSEQRLSVVDGINDRDAAYSITSEGFVLPVDEALRNDVDKHIDDAEIRMSVLDRARHLAGYALYNTFSHDGESILYLSGVQLSQSMQGRGITQQLNRIAIEEHNPDYFAFRTQSIRMFRSGIRQMLDHYPKLDSDYIPARIKEIGDMLARNVGGEFPFSRGYYGGKPLYSDLPSHEQDKEFYSVIDFHNGDAVLCVGALKRSFDLRSEMEL